MNPTIHRIRFAGAILLATVAVAGCVNYNPLDEPDGDPDATPRATVQPSVGASPIAAQSVVAGQPVRVGLSVAATNVVTIDVTDESGTLRSAVSGTPGDGASVEPFKLVVTNVDPATLRLTWLGGPCDSANRLTIDAPRRRLLLVQPECPGDAIATDRILDLTFATPIAASDLETFLQDGLDTPG